LKRVPFDADAYERRVQARPCFVCAVLEGDPEYRDEDEIVFENHAAIAFLNRFPTLYGYVIVAPRRHLEQVTGDFSRTEYLALQGVLYRIAEAVRMHTQAERVYLLSLGSQQGNRHVHWHVAPLPPGVPYAEQQLAALDMRKQGVLQMSSEERRTLRDQLRARLRDLA
jgi:diadenosine tetraphosphate (Ap4A) HIT family hydrolase